MRLPASPDKASLSHIPGILLTHADQLFKGIISNNHFFRSQPRM
jgi:hypothetical protein